LQPDSGRDSRSHQQVHNIANQHPVGETARRQEYTPRPWQRHQRERPGTDAATAQILLSVLWRGLCAPTRDCPETKATRDRISIAQPADNQRVVAHTYHHQQPYHNGQVQHPPNHMYQHHQEVQVLPPPPPHHSNPPHHNHPHKHPSRKTSPNHHIAESST
jgi:hypothetical protein